MKETAPIKDTVLSLRVPTDLDVQLKKVAEKMDLSKNDIARHILRAGLDSIESSKFRIEWPPIFYAYEPYSPEIKKKLKELLEKEASKNVE
jgi:hypothetical protein